MQSTESRKGFEVFDRFAGKIESFATKLLSINLNFGQIRRRYGQQQGNGSEKMKMKLTDIRYSSPTTYTLSGKS